MCNFPFPALLNQLNLQIQPLWPEMAVTETKRSVGGESEGRGEREGGERRREGATGRNWMMIQQGDTLGEVLENHWQNDFLRVKL